MDRNLMDASRNLIALGQNPYPGRGLVLGLDNNYDNYVQIYWIMGRSESSRNRILVDKGGGTLAVEAADPKKMEGQDTSLILYNAMRMGERGEQVVSNGHQTDAFVSRDGETCEGVLGQWEYESDAPNFTPRITGFHRHDATATISVIRKGPRLECERLTFEYEELTPGFGHCVHTYMGDGDPLPSFQGEPILVPTVGEIGALAQTYWEILNPDNKVSLAVKYIPLNENPSVIHIINKYDKVE